MKAVVAAFNQEKALVGAFSVIVQPVVDSMDRFAALVVTRSNNYLENFQFLMTAAAAARQAGAGLELVHIMVFLFLAPAGQLWPDSNNANNNSGKMAQLANIDISCVETLFSRVPQF